MAQSLACLQGKSLSLTLGVIGSLWSSGAALADLSPGVVCTLALPDGGAVLASPHSDCPTAGRPTPLPQTQEPWSAVDLANQTPYGDLTSPTTETELAPLELDPRILDESPVLRQWLDEIPDIAHEIRHTPSFRTRLRVGYANFPSSGEISGFQAGIDDVFVWPGTGLTASADYSRSGNGQREAYGAEARYYLLPLGGYVNVAPTLGYRSVSAPNYRTEGIDLGLRLMVVPSRGGGTDFSLSQHWVAPGTDGEVGLTRFNLGYAVTHQLRLGSDLEFQNSRFGQESRWGLSLEWLL